MKTKILLVTSILICCGSLSHAQIWKKLKQKTKDKIEERAKDKIENEISEDLADRAMRKIDKLYDDLWRKTYNDANGEDLSTEEFEQLLEESGESLSEALGELNKAADVPDVYNFNVIIDYAYTDESGEIHNSEMYFSRSEGIMGILTSEERKNMIMVMDADNDLMVIFNDDGKKKTAQAIPAMFSMASILSMTSEESQNYTLPFKSTGRTASVAGYSCKEYVAEDDESTFKFYMSNKLPFDWRNSYGELLKSVVPTMYDENEQKLEGMMMKSIETLKSGKTRTWQINKVSNLKTSINKSDYEFTGMN